MRFRSVVPAVISLALVAVTAADDLTPPPMKDGLWEVHSKMQSATGEHDTPLKMCLAKELTNPLSQAGKKMAKEDECTSHVTRSAPDTLVSESRCAKGNNAGKLTKIVYTYHGDTAYHMEMHMTGQGSSTVMIIDGKYLSSCPAGVKPGEVLTLDGKKMGS